MQQDGRVLVICLGKENDLVCLSLGRSGLKRTGEEISIEWFQHELGLLLWISDLMVMARILRMGMLRMHRMALHLRMSLLLRVVTHVGVLLLGVPARRGRFITAGSSVNTDCGLRRVMESLLRLLGMLLIIRML